MGVVHPESVGLVALKSWTAFYFFNILNLSLGQDQKKQHFPDPVQ